MGIIRALDNVMDWAIDGSAPWSTIKTLSLASIPVGIIMAPLLYFASENSTELEHTFENLDNRPTIVFQSVASCTDEGYSQVDCEASQQTALDVSGELGTTVSYSSESACTENHGSCDQRTWLQPVITSTGKTTIINQIPHTAYAPLVVAWQASANDLSISVPLYASAEEGNAVRKDGVMFNLDY